MAEENQENQWRRDLQGAQNETRNNQTPESSMPDIEPPEQEEYLPMQPELDTLPYNPPPYDPTISDADAQKSPQAAAEQLGRGITGKIRRRTMGCLFSSWLQILATLGLAFWSWLYLGIHYAMSYFGGPLSTLFPKPGREWIQPALDKSSIPEKLKKWLEERIGQVLEIFELMLASCCCGTCLIPIIVAGYVAFLAVHPCDTLGAISGFLRDAAGALGLCD